MTGLAVIVTQTVEGQPLHYLTGRFGTDYCGKLWNPTRAGVPKVRRVLVCSEYLSRTDLDRFGPPDQVIGCLSWADVLEHLEAEYPENARVAVFPCATMQCPETGSSLG